MISYEKPIIAAGSTQAGPDGDLDWDVRLVAHRRGGCRGNTHETRATVTVVACAGGSSP